MKKQLLTLISICLLLKVVANTINVPNPGIGKDIQPSILSALNLAKDGDILSLPPGKFVFNKTVTITKFVSLKGRGIANTVLYRDSLTPDNTLTSWGAMFVYNINKTIASNIVVSGITFKSKSPSIVDGDGKSLASDRGIDFIGCLDFVVNRCRFEYFGNGAITIRHLDTLARGLINKNEFYRNAKGSDGLGLGYAIVIYGENKQWISKPKFGSSNFIFIEDNTFDYHRHSIAAGGCALYVARYNTITNNIVGATASIHAIDTHGARGGVKGSDNYYSSRAIEVYNNNITNTTFKDGTTITPGQSATRLVEKAIGVRGCEAVVYGNTIKGYRFGTGIAVEATPFGTQYPLLYTTGYLSGVSYGSTHTGIDSLKGNGDLFYYDNNFYVYTGAYSSQDFYNYQPQYFKEDRDYHLEDKPNYVAYTYPHPLNFLVSGTGYKASKP